MRAREAGGFPLPIALPAASPRDGERVRVRRLRRRRGSHLLCATKRNLSTSIIEAANDTQRADLLFVYAFEFSLLITTTRTKTETLCLPRYSLFFGGFGSRFRLCPWRPLTPSLSPSREERNGERGRTPHHPCLNALTAEIGLGRESLYKALSTGSHPQFETINAVLRALGVKLSIVADRPQ